MRNSSRWGVALLACLMALTSACALAKPGSTTQVTNMRLLTLETPLAMQAKTDALFLTVGRAANESPLTVSGGTGAVRFAVSPALAPGLTLDVRSGRIAGTPTQASGRTAYVLTASDEGTPPSRLTHRFALTVSDLLTLTSTTAAATIRQGETVQLQPAVASGGVAPLRYTITPALPAPLAFDRDSGRITGQAGSLASTATYTIQVQDAAAPKPSRASASFTLSSIAQLTLVQNSSAIKIRPDAAMSAQPLTVTGGRAPLTYAISPPLPAGLQFDSASGRISGTPTVAQSPVQHTVTVSDSDAPQPATASGTFSLAVYDDLSLRVPASDYTVAPGADIDWTPADVAGGLAPLRYSVSPALPVGILLDAATGRISGRASTAQAATTYTLSVEDSLQPAAQQVQGRFNLAVKTDLAATALETRLVVVAQAPLGAQMLHVSGGVGPYRYALSGPALPAGLSFDTSSGTIQGAATGSAAETSRTITVQDQQQPAEKASATFTLKVLDKLAASVSVPRLELVVGDTIDTQPISCGGLPGVHYQVSPALPSGLALDAATGRISGTATAAATQASYTVTVSHTDHTVTQSESAAFTLTVAPALAATVAVAQVPAVTGAAVDAMPVTGQGGVGTITYAISPALPAGLSFDTATGRISGQTSTTLAATTFTVALQDSAVPTRHHASATFSLAVTRALTATQAVASTTLTALHTGAPFTPVTASGGEGPLAYAISPVLPAGLALDTATGQVSGTADAPSAATAYTVSVRDQGSPAQTATATFTLAVSAAPTLRRDRTQVDTYGRQAVTSVQVATASGGVAPLKVELASGSTLPAGLALSDKGVLTGTPATTAASASIQLQVRDANGAVSQPVALDIKVMHYGILRMGTGLTLGSAGLGCLTDGIATSDYDNTCVRYNLRPGLGFVADQTYFDLFLGGDEAILTSLRFTAYWRQSVPNLGEWQIEGCADTSCTARTPVSQVLPVGDGATVNVDTQGVAYRTYRIVFKGGSPSPNGGAGTANFSELYPTFAQQR